MKKRSLISASLLLLCLAACSPESIARKIREVSDKAPEPSPAPVAVVPPPATPLAVPESVPASQPSAGPLEASVQEKEGQQLEQVNAYIQCLNRTSVRTKESRERYLSWVNEKTGPTCSERMINYGLYTLYEDGVELCKKAAQKGAPGSAMQKSAADLAAAYADLVPLVQKAYDYYQQQDYKDDACAKAKLYHPQLMAAFSRFLQAQGQLESSLDSVKSEIDQKELARLEVEQGKKLPWYQKSFMINAEKLMHAFPRDEKVSMSTAAYLVAFPAVDQSYTALMQYVEQNPQEGKDTFMFSSLQSSAKDFFTKAKFLKRDLAEGKKPEPRTYNDVIQSYNRLVGDSNNLRFK